MVNPDLILQKFTPETAAAVWNTCGTDLRDTLGVKSKSSFFALIEGQEMAETLGEGLVRQVICRDAPIGFVVVNVVMSHERGDEEVVVECGTYLFPNIRGRGMNKPVKRAVISCAVSHFLATWCIFVIPLKNVRAQLAMEKLVWPAVKYQASDPGPFQSYLKRKIFDTGEESVLYALRTSHIRSHN